MKGKDEEYKSKVDIIYSNMISGRKMVALGGIIL